MPSKYINVTHRIKDRNYVLLPNDFTTSPNEKYIIIKKVRLINNNGQLDVGCCLCGNFADESSYSWGMIEDFIMCTNEMNEKEIHIHDTNLRELDFWFRDYKGNKITPEEEYYFTIELIDANNYEWIDGTTEGREYVWSIVKSNAPLIIALSVAGGVLVATGIGFAIYSARKKKKRKLKLKQIDEE